MNFIKPLMTAGLPLIKNVLTPSAKVVLIPLRLSAGMPTGDAAIKKIFDKLGNPSDLVLHATALIISNEKMKWKT